MARNKSDVKKIDYETCPAKHHVRLKGWMSDCNWQNSKVLRQIKNKLRKQPFTYFTFCASQAVDVYMLEMYGLLARDENDRLNTVYFCERVEEEFEKINSQIRSDKAGFFGEFEKIVLFQDDEKTIGKNEISEWADPKDKELINKFKQKDLHTRFKRLFPIDVVNLDVNGVFFPSDSRYLEMLKSLEKIFELQNGVHIEDEHQIDSFVLILNTHLEYSEYNESSINHLVKVSSDNVDKYETYKKEFIQKFKNVPSKAIAENFFPTFFSITLPKILFEMALRKGWVASKHSIYVYERLMQNGKKYHFMSSAIRYKKAVAIANQLPDYNEKPYSDEYAAEMCRILTDEPLYVDDYLRDVPEAMEEATTKLKAVVDFKKEFLIKHDIQLDP